MKNEKRTRIVTYALEWLNFCKACIDSLIEDIEADAKKQDEDKFYSYQYITNHTRYANDLIYIRRQLLKLEKELRG
jgi:hypothetical protein